MGIDPAALESYQEFMGEEAEAFILDIVSSYRENAPKLISAIEEALSGEDQEAFTRAAHTLKSNSATIGATDLSQLSAEMEQYGKVGELSGMQEKILQLKKELQSVLDELNVKYP